MTILIKNIIDEVDRLPSFHEYGQVASVLGMLVEVSGAEGVLSIGDHCHIATGAIMNGEVTLGNESFIGSGVITKQCISIGNNCTIGAAVILKTDVKSNHVVKN